MNINEAEELDVDSHTEKNVSGGEVIEVISNFEVIVDSGNSQTKDSQIEATTKRSKIPQIKDSQIEADIEESGPR